MFAQDSGIPVWLRWFFGVMVVYAVLYMFPATERFAGHMGEVIFLIAIFLLAGVTVRVIWNAFSRKG
jgi:hypothetical protein